ncbi:Hypothetical protein, putative [Bodo saltans]|uniref:Uncharacterized protein n=1 Tax=Bodo saltans TaxID=75058 RepID=A0A0S4K066_BODSA|nr:Hypothetical protein, putative [Bodo saltans]|eukprot:CUG94231.1 Hypothetical protein, putative [Bodo saltans]
MGTTSGRNVKKDLRVRSDFLVKFQQHSRRTRGDERRLLIDRSRKEEHYHQIEAMLGQSSSSSSWQASTSASSEDSNLVAQIAALVAIVPVDSQHPLLPLACRSLDILQCDLRAVDDAPLPNTLMKGLDSLIKAGVFYVLDAMLHGGGGPQSAQVALQVEDALHKSSPAFSILPLRTRRFEVIAAFVAAMLQTHDNDSLWNVTRTTLLQPGEGEAMQPTRDDFLYMGCSIILTLLDDAARRRDACNSHEFFQLVSSLYSWRPIVSARLLAKLCRCSDSVGPLYHHHATGGGSGGQLMQAAFQMMSFYRRRYDLVGSICAAPHPQEDLTHDNDCTTFYDCFDIVYYGYVCFRSLLPHAPWNSLEMTVEGELPHLCSLAASCKWEKVLMEEVLLVLQNFPCVVQKHEHSVLPFLQDLFRNRSSLRDDVLDVFAASPGLFISNVDFLYKELFPHYRAKKVSRLRLLDALAAVCRDHREKVIALVEDEDAMGWITVMPDDELSEREHEKLEILLETLGLAGEDFWSDDASSPTWKEEGVSPTNTSQVHFLF